MYKIFRKIIHFLSNKDKIVFTANGKTMWINDYIQQRNWEYRLEKPWEVNTAVAVKH